MIRVLSLPGHRAGGKTTVRAVLCCADKPGLKASLIKLVGFYRSITSHEHLWSTLRNLDPFMMGEGVLPALSNGHRKA